MADQDTPDFAELLRRARRAAGLSQEELAERAGLSARAISALERGINRAPRRDTLDMLADALELSADERRRWEHLRRQRATRTPPGPKSDSKRTDTARLDNLPFQPTRFFGREDELASVTRMLREDRVRIVTLTGPGGSGKTRLALQVAASLLNEYPDGVYFVDLSPLSNPNLLLPTISTTLGLRPRADQPSSTTLTEWLHPKRLLLVLDNLEQILAAATDIGELVSRCTDVQVLATSRAPLRLRAEREFPVPPLPLPLADSAASAGSAADYDVVRLFEDRARAVLPSFNLGAEETLIIARICRQLDGLPLAIELAAACARLFPPRTILERLNQHLPLPDSRQRDMPERQHTMHDAIGWSYDLLNPEDQAIFRRLSLFKGGWTLEAAEAVGADNGVATGYVLQGSMTLVEHNLIQSHEWQDGSPRFGMLETIREFGLTRLEASEELQATSQRHASYFIQLFSGSERDWHTQRAETWLQRGGAEIENVRLALTWAIVHDPETALRLVRETSWIWSMHSAHPESLYWLERALASADDVADELRAGTVWWIGAIRTTLSDYALARAAIDEALAIYADLGNDIGMARCLHALGRIAMFEANSDEALVLYESAAERLRQHHDPSLTVTLSNLGAVLLRSGKLDRAAAVLNEALAHAERDGLDWHRSQILNLQGHLSIERGDLPGARETLRRCLELNRNEQDLRFVAQSLETCAWLAAVEGAAAHAARLLGAANRLRESAGVPVPPSAQREYDHYVPIAQARISNADWQRARAEGYALSQFDAIEVALQGLT